MQDAQDVQDGCLPFAVCCLVIAICSLLFAACCLLLAVCCFHLFPMCAFIPYMEDIQSEFRPGEDGICPDSYEKNTGFRNEYMTFFTPDALVSSHGMDVSREIFF